jgi:hypothetical protein
VNWEDKRERKRVNRMAWVCEVTCTGEPSLANAVSAWFDDAPAQKWAKRPELSALDIYRSIEDGAKDPFNDDKNGPLLIVMLEFKSPSALASARVAIERELSRLPADVAVTVTGMERKFYPVAGENAASPLRAPFSYVVRYHRPAEDEAAFIDNYISTHPETLGKLPKIRSVMCYFPVSAPPGRYPAADYMIGNEVVFDTLADFNEAMQSPVRQELRQHFREFPPFTGINTHFPMNRVRLTG